VTERTASTAQAYTQAVPVLKKRVVYGRMAPRNETRRSYDLSPKEQAHVRAALRFMRKRLGSAEKLAAALQMGLQIVSKACVVNEHTKPNAGMAIRVARLAGVSVEDVLEGRFPAPGACPLCGRGGVPLLGSGR